MVVEYYRCSSDPDSLDGLVIPSQSVGIVDATSPHGREPRYPGAKETLLDLGTCWDASQLRGRAAEIRDLTDGKAEAYAAVYQHMSAAATLRNERRRILASCTETEKMRRAVARLVSGLKGKKGGHSLTRQIGSIGMKGSVMLPTYEGLAKVRWQICDGRGLSGVLMEELRRQAEAAGCALWLSRNYAGEVEALYFPEEALAITCDGDGEKADRLLNTERFLSRERLSEQRGRLRFLARMEEELMARVAQLFGEIKEYHFALEGIYGEAMNYCGVEALTEELICCLGLA
jgi:hypothetical protein